MVPHEEYQRLVAEAEMLQDIRAYDEAKLALANGAKELIPSEVTYALTAGLIKIGPGVKMGVYTH